MAIKSARRRSLSSGGADQQTTRDAALLPWQATGERRAAGRGLRIRLLPRRAQPAAEDARPKAASDARAGAGAPGALGRSGVGRARKPPRIELATKRVVHDYDVGEPDADVAVAVTVNPLNLGRRAPQTAAI